MDVFSILFPIGITVLVLVLTIVPLALFLVPFLKRHAQASKILQSGMSGQAQVLSVQETGTRLNDQPEIAFVLMVQLPGRAPYQAQATSVMSQLLLARVQPGMTVPVKVDPANPQSVAIDKVAMSGVPGMAMMPGMVPQQPMMGGMMPGQPMQGMMPAQPMQAMMPGQPMQAMMPGQPMMGGMMPGAMSQQQAMALAQQAMAQPPAGGAIINCPACGGPYAIANPACPHCRAPRPRL